MKTLICALLGAWIVVGSAAAGGRVHGTVELDDGRTFTGPIRWGGDEFFWDQTVDSRTREVEQEGGFNLSLFGMRIVDPGRSVRIRSVSIPLGLLRSIEPLPGKMALLTLKDGEEIEVEAKATQDLGDGLGVSEVIDSEHGTQRIAWHRLRRVSFSDGPADPLERQRLYGTVVTTSGDELTGFLAWDHDETMAGEELDGDDRQSGRSHEIPFREIREIHRLPGASRVVLRGDEELTLDGTNDVDDDNRGIYVRTADLGRADVEWEVVNKVVFVDPPASPSYDEFVGGGRLRGTVKTTIGTTHHGWIEWDRDETHGWQTLDGDQAGISYEIPFAVVRAIVPTGPDGCEVRLTGDRVIALSGSNDVNASNRGIVIHSEGTAGTTVSVDVDWDELAEVVFD